MFDGKVPHWHHYSCFWKRARIVSHTDIDGFPELRWEDQEKIKKAIETGGPGGGRQKPHGVWRFSWNCALFCFAVIMVI